MKDLSFRYYITRVLSKVKNRDITKIIIDLAKDADSYTKKCSIED